MKGWFVTGTDTEIGKTRAAVALIQALRRRGLQPAAMKPVASGCRRHNGKWRNDDALDLIHACGRALPYAAVNPYAFEPPIAPHLAAARVGQSIDLDRVQRGRDLLVQGADCLVVEGVGGWAVPLGDGVELRDLVRRLDLTVVLVVGLRLGCLNHALLSARQIRADGLELAGWIGSVLNPDMAALDDNLAALGGRLGCPRLGLLPHEKSPDPDHLGRHLDLSPLLD